MCGLGLVVIVTQSLETRVHAQQVIATALAADTMGMRDGSRLQSFAFWHDHDVALVLIDDTLAREDDYQLVRSVNDMNPELLMVLLGRNPQQDGVVKGFEAGAADVWPLPLQRGEATARLKAVLRTRLRDRQPTAIAATAQEQLVRPSATQSCTDIILAMAGNNHQPPSISASSAARTRTGNRSKRLGD